METELNEILWYLLFFLSDVSFKSKIKTFLFFESDTDSWNKFIISVQVEIQTLSRGR